ncbi:MAG: hypothetical protein K1060chlam5_00641 [Candidatus Anoxychlamydiales bacterium]|nr:hypothetical protein [Candidatus Anoxychlamydiales bacterium]
MTAIAAIKPILTFNPEEYHAYGAEGYETAKDPNFFKLDNIVNVMHPKEWGKFKQTYPNKSDTELLEILKKEEISSYIRIHDFSIWWLLHHNNDFIDQYNFERFCLDKGLDIQYVNSRFQIVSNRWFTSHKIGSTWGITRFPPHNQKYDICMLHKCALNVFKLYCPIEYLFLKEFIGGKDQNILINDLWNKLKDDSTFKSLFDIDPYYFPSFEERKKMVMDFAKDHYDEFVTIVARKSDASHLENSQAIVKGTKF